MKTTVVEGVLTSYELMLAILFRWRVGDCQDSIQTLLKFGDCEVFAMISERSCLWN